MKKTVKKIVILGGGVSGKAAEKLALKLGCRAVIISDGPGAVLPECDLVVVSPGIHPLRSDLYAQSMASGVETISEMEFGCRHFSGRILAITGTNGKTTTTELTTFLLKGAGVNAAFAGNIGVPLSELAAADIQPDVAVVEVSSFQLELPFTFAPEAAALLNLESDHEDRYRGGFEEYCRVKKKIFDHVPESGRIWGLSFADRRRRVDFCGDMLLIDGKEIMDVSKTALAAPHNRENLAAAVELFLRILILSKQTECLPELIKAFRCGRHRIELFHEVNGVKFYDDSKGTNPAAVTAAVNALSGPVILLAGGLDKGMDFSKLTEVSHRLKQLVVYGECRAAIAAAFEGSGLPVKDCGTDFESAVKAAGTAAASGDNVMLSPACASMDMFKNYQERGERFKELVFKYFAH